jgi:hypothetical protein
VGGDCSIRCSFDCETEVGDFPLLISAGVQH